MAPPSGSAAVSMRVTCPRTAPTELATSSRARIGTTVVACAAALVPLSASATQSSRRDARPPGGAMAGERLVSRPRTDGARGLRVVVRGMPRQNSENGSGFSS
jgi:hypothetical protein